MGFPRSMENGAEDLRTGGISHGKSLHPGVLLSHPAKRGQHYDYYSYIHMIVHKGIES